MGVPLCHQRSRIQDAKSFQDRIGKDVAGFFVGESATLPFDEDCSCMPVTGIRRNRPAFENQEVAGRA